MILNPDNAAAINPSMFSGRKGWHLSPHFSIMCTILKVGVAIYVVNNNPLLQLYVGMSNACIVGS